MEEPPAMDEAAQRREQERVSEALKKIVGEKQAEADHRVTARVDVEKRWIEGLLQYHGKYEGETKATSGNPLRQTQGGKDGVRSQVFMNLTGPKTDSFAARLFDMLFPTDDRNWDIQPTPDPELSAQAERAVAVAQPMAEAADQAAQAGDPVAAQAIADKGNAIAKPAQDRVARQEEARRRNDAMRLVMDDQLSECLYSAEARDVITDGCKAGTGVMKGPIRNMRMKRRWKETTALDQTGAAVAKHVSEEVANPKPAFNRVSYWAFFPDPEATDVRDSADFYERHLMNDKQLRRLARVPGFDQEAIKRVLKADAKTAVPQYMTDLRSINDLNLTTKVERHIVWEWYGALTAEDVRDICSCLGMADMAKDYEDEDPLTEIPVCMWFCNGEVLKFGDYHMDSAEPLYSTFCIKPDEASIWGYGIPYIINHPQRAFNAGWRMMLDNMGLSSMPQLIIDKTMIEPEDGVWEFRPGKIWLALDGADMRPGHEPFRVVHIDGHQPEAANLIKISAEAIDQVADFPMVAQGGEGPHTTQTFGGLSILSNNANVVLRRVVKAWDDNITVPNLSQLYDWNMQFSEREDIKGDFEVSARGSSVLLTRELQSQNLMIAVTQFSSHPVLGPMVRKKMLHTLRRTYQSMMLDPDEHVATDEEWKQIEAEMAAQPPPPDPEMMKIEAQMKLAQMKLEGDLQIEQLRHETAMMTLAETLNMSRDEIKAKYGMKQMEVDHKERKVAAEIAVESRRPQQVKLA